MVNELKYSTVLGLDVSSKSTGFAVVRNGRWRKSSNSYGKIDIGSDFSLAQKLFLFRNELAKVIEKTKPDLIVIEDVFGGRNIKTMKMLARFNGVAIELSRRLLSKDPEVVLTAKVRSFLGCGKSKEEAFAYICKRYHLDWSFSGFNDIADAIALALYGYSLFKREKS